jgi:rubrerythrin
MKKMTEKSLNEAFAGESMAHMKYLIFSEIAEKEGYSNIARLFKAIAYAEQVHAKNHARNLGIIKDTKENLQAGIDGETFEVKEMYPAYDAIAKIQGERDAQRSIYYALEAEKIHVGLYQEAKQAIEAGKDIESRDIYICPVCGTPKEKFKKF